MWKSAGLWKAVLQISSGFNTWSIKAASVRLMQKSCKSNTAINQFCSVIWNIANKDQGRILKGVMATSNANCLLSSHSLCPNWGPLQTGCIHDCGCTWWNDGAFREVNLQDFPFQIYSLLLSQHHYSFLDFLYHSPLVFYWHNIAAIRYTYTWPFSSTYLFSPTSISQHLPNPLSLISGFLSPRLELLSQ